MRYLKYGIIDESTTVPGLVPAAERLAYIKMSYKEQRAYDEYCYDMAYQNNVIAAYKLEGKTEGQAETSLEIARRMKAMGMSVDTISQVTQLPSEVIGSL